MGVIITREDIIAYAEVDYIINHMNEKYQEMIPESIRNFFATIKEPGYNANIDPRKPLANQGLRQYTLEIIALLHLKYWCQDEERKQELYNRMKQNQMMIESKIQEQYGVENLFSSSSVVSITSNDDFSKPKVITRYSQIAENNSDVTDYSDVIGVEEEPVKEEKKKTSKKSKDKKEDKQENKKEEKKDNKKDSKDKKGKESKDSKNKTKKDDKKTDGNKKQKNTELTSVKEKQNIFDKLSNFIKNIFKKK